MESFAVLFSFEAYNQIVTSVSVNRIKQVKKKRYINYMQKQYS